jgi:anion-transporting  ArsA/GET3 family ATPase
MNLASKKIIFVSGKGGVGKSVCAAAVAWQQARLGKHVCLVELGNQSFYESFFQTRGIGYEPSEIIRDIHISIYTPEMCLREYVLHFLKVPKLYDLFFQNKVMKAFMNAAPAIAELSILGKLTGDQRGILRKEYDTFVVDCYSTGHAMALLRAPRGLSETFKSGPLFEQSRDIDKILCDPTKTHFVVTTLPEEMPVSETLEFCEKLKAEFNADPTVVCNGIVSPPLGQSELKEIEAASSDSKLKEFINYVLFKVKIQCEQLDRISKDRGSFYGVPQIFNATNGQRYVEEFSTYLEKPWISTNY